MTLGTRRLIAGLAVLLAALLVWHLITPQQFGDLFGRLLSAFVPHA